MQGLLPRNAAQRKFAWAIRLSLVVRVVAVFVLLALVLTWLGVR